MTEYQYDLLDRYFQKALSPEEMAIFRPQLEADAELRQAFNLRRLAAAALLRTDVQAFKQKTLQAQQPQAGLPAANATVRRLSAYRWALAAAASILLAVAGWWFFGKTADRSQQLFARYDVPELYPDASLVVNEGTLHKGIIRPQTLGELKTQALQAYDAKDWNTAIRLLGEYLQKARPTDEETADEINLMNLYLGRAWLENGSPGNAIAALQKAEAGITDLASYGLFRELIRWQLALAHLRNNDREAARPIVESLLGAEQTTIREQANLLIKDL